VRRQDVGATMRSVVALAARVQRPRFDEPPTPKASRLARWEYAPDLAPGPIIVGMKKKSGGLRFAGALLLVMPVALGIAAVEGKTLRIVPDTLEMAFLPIVFLACAVALLAGKESFRVGTVVLCGWSLLWVGVEAAATLSLPMSERGFVLAIPPGDPSNLAVLTYWAVAVLYLGIPMAALLAGQRIARTRGTG
jgi:hypothetical protein